MNEAKAITRWDVGVGEGYIPRGQGGGGFECAGRVTYPPIFSTDTGMAYS